MLNDPENAARSSPNLIGSALGCGVTILGAFRGQVTFAKSNIKLVLAALIAVSVVPVVVELHGHRSTAASAGDCPADPQITVV